MTDELVPISKQFPVFAANHMEVAELLEENLGGEGIDRFELERIKVGSGGAPGFVIVPPDGGDEDVTKEINAIIVFQHSCRTYFATQMDEGGAAVQPDCQSQDATTGSGNNGDGVGKHSCDTCPQAQWGSDPRTGRGQACRLQKAVYLYREGAKNVFPSMLLIPPTSLKPWRKYGIGLVGSGVKLTAALHVLGTKKGSSQSGQDYTEVAPKFGRRLTDDEIVDVSMLAESIEGVVAARRKAPQDKGGFDEMPSL